ncbi:MAG: FlgD immunoglobulin-like domain containing protein [Gemmatimonadota bacterium]|jgi:hypothetical protein|nr:FlgD immunoglobulin-like domain containing protein [Gemmatimonadota bacterium]MDP7031875.1 FlgD immunoglobulin-like domain containing protein [Gemmatimonadota bacterium]
MWKTLTHSRLSMLLAMLLAAPVSSGSADAAPPANAAYVIGSNDATITRVDLDSGSVVNAIASVGSGANRVELSDDESALLVVNSSSGDLTLFDLLTQSTLTTTSLPAGSNPWAVEFPGESAFVSALGANAVYEVHPWTGAVTDTAAVGKSPEGMCRAGGWLFVANTGFDFTTYAYDPGTVTVLDPAGLSVVATIPVGTNPQACLPAPDGTVHVICTGDFFLTTGEIHVVDPVGLAPLDTLPIPAFPGGGAIDTTGLGWLSITTPSFASEIWSYNANTLTLLHGPDDPLIPGGGFYGNPRLDPDGHLLVPDFGADLLYRLDHSAPDSLHAWAVNDGPIDLAVVETDASVGLAMRPPSAWNAPDGIRLSWTASPYAGVAGFAIDRQGPANTIFSPVATNLPFAEVSEWTDAATRDGYSYTYRVGWIHSAGDLTFLPPVTLVRSAPAAPTLAVGRAFPQPFRTTVTLELSLPNEAEATVTLFDVSGRSVAELRPGRLPAGGSRVTWDGRTDAGEDAAPGVYFTRVRAAGESVCRRILRVR